MLSDSRLAHSCSLWAATLGVLSLASSSVIAAPTVRFKTLHELQASEGVVSGPSSPLVKGTDGRLYGALQSGGPSNAGALFAITRQGDFSLLYSFTGGLDGGQPSALFRDPGGQIYGTTLIGGSSANAGVLFSLGANGPPTVVHSFSGLDGTQPSGTVQFKQGSFYGMTGFGGNLSAGTVYRFTPPSTVETIHEFNFFVDQSGPYYGLSKAGGKFYGTMHSDFTFPGYPNDGTVFRITDSGQKTVLHTFTGAVEGSRPVGPPILAADGNLYGVTSQGGEFGCGSLYRIDAAGTFAVVHAFTGNWEESDGGGCTPFAALTLGNDGKLYGSTYSGADEYGMGLLFRLSVTGEFEVLHRFQSSNHGGNVMSPLIEGRPGTFFGMTTSGASNTGSVFKLVVREAE